MQLFHITLV